MVQKSWSSARVAWNSQLFHGERWLTNMLFHARFCKASHGTTHGSRGTPNCSTAAAFNNNAVPRMALQGKSWDSQLFHATFRGTASCPTAAALKEVRESAKPGFATGLPPQDLNNFLCALGPESLGGAQYGVDAAPRRP